MDAVEIRPIQTHEYVRWVGADQAPGPKGSPVVVRHGELYQVVHIPFLGKPGELWLLLPNGSFFGAASWKDAELLPASR